MKFGTCKLHKTTSGVMQVLCQFLKRRITHLTHQKVPATYAHVTAR